jgi:hypothetical protein
MQSHNFKLIQEINQIISEIEDELNQLPKEAKKSLHCTVYSLGNNLNTEDKGSKYYAFIIKKSFWKNNMSLELMSSLDVYNTNELQKVKFKIDNYKLYKTSINLSIFDEESLITIKRFLQSFAE